MGLSSTVAIDGARVVLVSAFPTIAAILHFVAVYAIVGLLPIALCFGLGGEALLR